MKRLIKNIVFATILVMFIACTGETRKIITFSVNGVEYSRFLAVNDTVDLTTLSTEFDAEIRMNEPTDFNSLKVDGVSLGSGIATIPVKKISKDSYITLEWEKEGHTGTILLRTLHSQIPDIQTTGKAESSGDFYLSFVNLRLIAKINNDGEILFYRYEHQKPLKNDCTGWWDFKKHIVGTKTYYSYHAPDPKFSDLKFDGFNPGMRVILDEHYNPIENKTLHLLASRGDTIKVGDPVDGHDFYMYDLNHYIVSSYIKIKDKDVYAAYLQEVRNGKVVFDWLSTDHPEMEKWMDSVFLSTPGEKLKDYVHFNSIDVLPDGNWLCSFRHISSVLKIERKNKTGHILWRLGGAVGDSLYSFHGQHYVRYHEKEKTITLFNNGNGTNRTQMLRLDINTDTGKVTKSTILHDDGYYTQACGALTFSGDNMIVGWGIPGDSNTNNRLVTEYNASDSAIFSICRPTNNDTINAIFGSYRCAKYK